MQPQESCQWVDLDKNRGHEACCYQSSLCTHVRVCVASLAAQACLSSSYALPSCLPCPTPNALPPSLLPHKQDPDSWDGQKLLRRGAAHTGCWVTGLARMPLATLDGSKRQGLLGSTAQGGLLLLSPFWDEAMFRRMTSLYVSVLTHGVKHERQQTTCIEYRCNWDETGMSG